MAILLISNDLAVLFYVFVDSKSSSYSLTKILLWSLNLKFHVRLRQIFNSIDLNWGFLTSGNYSIISILSLP